MSALHGSRRHEQLHTTNAMAREARLAFTDARLLADTRRCMVAAREALPWLTLRAQRLERSIRLRAEFVERSAGWLDWQR